MRAKTIPKAVIIKTTPPWLVGDITASGGDCPGARTGVVESIKRAVRDEYQNGEASTNKLKYINRQPPARSSQTTQQYVHHIFGIYNETHLIREDGHLCSPDKTDLLGPAANVSETDW